MIMIPRQIIDELLGDKQTFERNEVVAIMIALCLYILDEAKPKPNNNEDVQQRETQR